MKKVMIDIKNYQLLALEIIAQAVKDYTNAVLFLKHEEELKDGYQKRIFYKRWGELADARISGDKEQYKKAFKNLRKCVWAYNGNVRLAKGVIYECEQFFRSGNFELFAHGYTEMDGEEFIQKLNKRIEEDEKKREKELDEMTEAKRQKALMRDRANVWWNMKQVLKTAK